MSIKTNNNPKYSEKHISDTYLAMSRASSENSSSVQGPPVITGMEDGSGLGFLTTCVYEVLVISVLYIKSSQSTVNLKMCWKLKLK